jgi:hypothetical protein
VTAGTAPRAAARGNTTKSAARPDARPNARSAQRAAAQVLDKHTIRVTLPDDIGTLRLPPPDRLAFYGGIAALAAFGIVDWPVALVIGIGHMLADDHHHKCLAEFGEALGEV